MFKKGFRVSIEKERAGTECRAANSNSKLKILWDSNLNSNSKIIKASSS